MTQFIFFKYNTSCLFLFIANGFQFSEMGTSPCNICAILKKNEYMKNMLFLKMFRQGIALRDIKNQNFLRIYFQLFLCHISKKHFYPTPLLRILWMVFSLLLGFISSMSAIIKEFCL